MRKIFKALVIICLIIYLYLALRLLIFRNTMQFSYILENIGRPRYRGSYNLVPFRTINAYINAIADRSMSRSIPIQNIVGNVLAFMPLGFFLPFFIKKMAELRRYAITVSISIMAVELLQFILMVGSMDVDDFILNLAGALIGFVICKLKPISKLMMI